MSNFITNLALTRKAKKQTNNSPTNKRQPSEPAHEEQPLLVKATDRLAGEVLFDEKYYLATYPEFANTGCSPLDHFIGNGWLEGRRPNPYFDPLWYLDQNPDVREGDMTPLVHYALHGDSEGRAPCAWFDTDWYRAQHKLDKGDLALAHFLRQRLAYRYNPIPEFDVEYYINSNPDIRAAGVDPFLHFLDTGYREGRNPSREFDVKFYVRKYMGGEASENPLLHYRRHKTNPGVYTRMPDEEATIPREVKRFTQPGPEFEVFRALPNSAPRRAKVFAYYLPQFHPIPQNNTWWGTGFTEWTNVVRGLPRFKGHYQPRIPRDLGFYSLDTDGTLRRQAELAHAAGIDGFLFYYYSFNGTRLLERPIERFLADPSIDIKFSLIWANENWTRRWDGLESEVLISQDYLDKHEEALIADFARHFADPRYIRLQGRPLLVIYRPGLIPQAGRVLARWRQLFDERFGEEPIIVMAQGFGDLDPAVFGLDGAVEFPPHKICQDMKGIEHKVELLDSNFDGHILNYDEVVTRSLKEVQPNFPLLRTALPSWDNDARRQGSGTVIVGSTPHKYEMWLSHLIANAIDYPFFGEPIVCVNAWNEWAEGAYLEPDQYYGSAYLNATGRAVTNVDRAGNRGILLIGHDANPHGAQELLLNIGRTLRDSFGVALEYLLLDTGVFISQYESIAKVTVAPDRLALESYFSAARRRGFSNAIVNTTVSARVVKIAADKGINCIVLIHELARFIEERSLVGNIEIALKHARRIVFPASYVRDEILRLAVGSTGDNAIVRPQGTYKVIDFSLDRALRVREELGVGASEVLVLAVGYADLRKGFDLFIQLWRMLRDQSDRVHFLWVGRRDRELEVWLRAEIEDAAATGTFHLLGSTDDIGAYYSAADAFVLTSREDPFPSVVLEALSAGVPILAFDRSGGIPEMLLEHNAGTVLPYGDIVSMAAALRLTLQRGPIPDVDRAARRNVIDTHFRWKSYVGDLLLLALPDHPRVSVALPNYNYAPYLGPRLGSIFTQTHPVHEILVLDDCSTDDSLDVIATISADWKREIQLVQNQQNSGSVFAQWRKAALLAEGEFLWIAEADDESSPEFLTRLCSTLIGDPSICMAFSDSRVINTKGEPIGENYKSYYSSVEPAALAESRVFEGTEFVERFLSVKNLILNVSAVVWRREALLRALDRCWSELLRFKMAGDWRLYMETLMESGARIAYEAEPLNVHRRHEQSVTHALDPQKHVREIARIHRFIRRALRPNITRRDDQNRYLAEITDQLGADAKLVQMNTPNTRRARIRSGSVKPAQTQL